MTTAINAPVDSEQHVLALASRVLSRRLGPSDLDTPLSFLGIDSLRLIELLAEVEQETGAPVGPSSAACS